MNKYLKLGLLSVAAISIISCGQTATAVNVQNRKITSTKEVSKTIISERYDVAYGNKNIYGMITAPSNYRELNLPLIVLSHGFNNTLEMFSDYTNFLANLGYVVYSFDFYGGSRQSKSGGRDMLDMSVITELEDLTAVVDKLSSESFVNKEKISLTGVSQGGVISTLYAARNQGKVDKLVLIFPAFVLFDDVKETYKRYGEENAPGEIVHRNARLGLKYLTDALSVNIADEQKKVDVPTLIIHGTNDNVVPYRYATEAIKNMSNSSLMTVQGGCHWMNGSFNNVAKPAIEEFLK